MRRTYPVGAPVPSTIVGSGGASGFVRLNGLLVETGRLVLAAVVAEARADGV